MSLSGRFEADSTGFSRTADVSLAPVVFDSYRFADVNLLPAGTGFKNEAALQDGMLEMTSIYPVDQSYMTKVGSAKLENRKKSAEMSDDTAMDGNFLPDDLQFPTQINQFGDEYGVNSKGEVVLFDYKQNGDEENRFLVFGRDENGEINQFQHNDVYWTREGDEWIWQTMDGNHSEEGYQFDITIDANGVKVDGLNADMFRLPA
ncbi:MAG: hypothetical protein C0507_16440 [Cyanobacteria bacterium PR.3.49]|nr:hypothetical protein [Cyanobacteria bacterium PR.3.49]